MAIYYKTAKSKKLQHFEMVNLAARAWYHDNEHDAIARDILKMYFAYAIQNIKNGHKVTLGDITMTKKRVRVSKGMLSEASRYWVAV
jgi:hypothetical protein